ncbi:GNAT family N-acetyltransferase [Aliiruegeria sabulilitoris]|uniref:GNAT family N-acetyltransferase n=1 Tax=Aliiruegeria sabulilitoris TaxID=1510458 RepID=UPI000829FB2E|nr:N-acetyltransferase [Aliiruegeria sabulilitoris]NDR59203.1 N-acetyltransferase [Pseudoruegeria sp. M32A2M]
MARDFAANAAAVELVIRAEHPTDVPAREALLDTTMGTIRFSRSSERLREGRLPALSLVAQAPGGLVGTVRLWHVRAGGLSGALMLGPLAVDPTRQGLGIGAALMHSVLATLRAQEFRAVVLVGDPPYYERFGFHARHARRLHMPGPFERHRLLGLPLEPGALDHAHGVLRPCGPSITQAVPERATASRAA